MKTRILLLAGAAAVYVGYRLFQNYRTKSGTQNLTKQLKDASAAGITSVAEAFAEELDVVVQRTPITDVDGTQQLAPYLNGTHNRLGDFRLNHVQALSGERYLFVTTADYQESIKAGKRIEINELHNPLVLARLCRVSTILQASSQKEINPNGLKPINNSYSAEPSNCGSSGLLMIGKR